MSILFKYISSHCFVRILNVRRPEVTASPEALWQNRTGNIMWQDNTSKWKHVDHAPSRKQDS